MSAVLTLCCVPASAVQEKEIPETIILSEEAAQYYYEDALSRAIAANKVLNKRSVNDAGEITYINGGAEMYGENLVRQTIIEVTSASDVQGSVGIIAARSTDYWYRFELLGKGDLMVTVVGNCQFKVTHGVSVVENNHVSLDYEIEPGLQGILYVNKGKYSWTVSADKKTCTFEYKYQVDYDGFLHSKTIKIKCDYNANVTSPDHEYKI